MDSRYLKHMFIWICASRDQEEMPSACLEYDSRKRPWYSGAISYPNHLVILVDCGKTMSNDAGVESLLNKLQVAQNFSLSLMDTVYKNNYINVITFGAEEDDNYSTSRSVQVEFDPKNPSVHKELDNLRYKIGNLSYAPSDTSVSSFVNGLNTTLEAFSDTTLPNYAQVKRLQNVIILTDGAFAAKSAFLSEPSVAEILSQVKENNVRLFIYSDTDYEGLKSLADLVNGSYTDLAGYDNPLHEMRSYFGYLAASHRKVFNDTPFWSPNYRDYYGVEDIITVTMPAFVEDQFVGVAAIDILLDELPDGAFRDDFSSKVTDRRNEQEETLSRASSEITLPVPPVFNDFSCSLNSNPVCQASPDDLVFNEAKFLDRKCRNSCGGKGDGNKLGVILGSLGGVLGAIAVGLILVLCIRQRRKGKPIPPETVRTFPEDLDPSRKIGQESWTQPL